MSKRFEIRETELATLISPTHGYETWQASEESKRWRRMEARKRKRERDDEEAHARRQDACDWRSDRKLAGRGYGPQVSYVRDHMRISDDVVVQPWYWRACIYDAYDPANTEEYFETEEKCRQLQKRRIKLFRQSKSKAHNELADVLELCAEGARCGSTVCMHCRRQLRRVFTSQTLHLTHQHEMYAATLILDGYESDKGSTRKSIMRFKRLIADRLRRILPAQAVAFGFIEIEINLEGLIVPHLHVTICGCPRETARKLLNKKRDLKKGRSARFPLRVKEVTNPGGWVTYTLKSIQPENRHRRQAWQHVEAGQKQAAATRLRHYLFALHKLGEKSLGVLVGLRRDRNAPRLRMINREPEA